jgi:hypothetical protein
MTILHYTLKVTQFLHFNFEGVWAIGNENVDYIELDSSNGSAIWRESWNCIVRAVGCGHHLVSLYTYMVCDGASVRDGK